MPVDLRCPSCGVSNRVPTDRLGDKPTCGKCRVALFSGGPLTLDQAEFERFASEDIPLLVDFWAPWCGQRCRHRRVGAHFQSLNGRGLNR